MGSSCCGNKTTSDHRQDDLEPKEKQTVPQGEGLKEKNPKDEKEEAEKSLLFSRSKNTSAKFILSW